MERVSTIKGSSPILILVPHGYDDPNTSVVAEQIVNELDAYAVINRGWERGDHYNYYKDIANCNNIDHINEDVVKEEFLDPILNYAQLILANNEEPNIFIIHGVSNSIRAKAGSDLDIIVGHGNGKPPSLSCPDWYKDFFINELSRSGTGFDTYEGKAGGAYSGRKKENLNQLFRQTSWSHTSIFSMQLEIVRERRKDYDTARKTGDRISNVIEDVVKFRMSLPDPNILSTSNKTWKQI